MLLGGGAPEDMLKTFQDSKTVKMWQVSVSSLQNKETSKKGPSFTDLKRMFHQQLACKMTFTGRFSSEKSVDALM